MRHQSADCPTLSLDFTFAGEAYTVASVYAPCAAADRAALFIHHLLPSLLAQERLLLGDEFSCITDQLDILDPASAAGGRSYYDGLRIVEPAL